MPESSPDKLHAHALKAERELEQLATGLARAGADPAAVKATTQMADVCRRLAAGIAKQGLAGRQSAPPEPQQPQQPPTMDTAANQLQAQLQARRAQQP